MGIPGISLTGVDINHSGAVNDKFWCVMRKRTFQKSGICEIAMKNISRLISPPGMAVYTDHIVPGPEPRNNVSAKQAASSGDQNIHQPPVIKRGSVGDGESGLAAKSASTCETRS